MTLTVPPLRERPTEIEPLARLFAESASRRIRHAHAGAFGGRHRGVEDSFVARQRPRAPERDRAGGAALRRRGRRAQSPGPLVPRPHRLAPPRPPPNRRPRNALGSSARWPRPAETRAERPRPSAFPAAPWSERSRAWGFRGLRRGRARPTPARTSNGAWPPGRATCVVTIGARVHGDGGAAGLAPSKGGADSDSDEGSDEGGPVQADGAAAALK